MSDYSIGAISYGADNYILKDLESKARIAEIIDSGQKNVLNVFLSPGANPQNGIKWLVHSDGTVTANGTATANSYFYIWPNNSNKTITYRTVLNGCSGGSSTTYEIQTASSSGTVYHQYGDPLEFISGFTFKYVALCIRKGYTASNLTFRPMLCSKEDYEESTAFQPYRHSLSDLYARYIDEGAKNKLHVTSLDVANANGRSFVLNSDGSVTVSGSPTSSSTESIATLQLNGSNVDVSSYCNGLYILTGCPSGGGNSTYRLQAAKASYATYDYGDGALLILASGTGVKVEIVVKGSYTISSSLTFRPMVCSLEDYAYSTAYQPYRPSYQELYDMIKALQT